MKSATLAMIGIALNLGGSALLDATSHRTEFGDWSDWGYTGWSLRLTGFVTLCFTFGRWLAEHDARGRG